MKKTGFPRILGTPGRWTAAVCAFILLAWQAAAATAPLTHSDNRSGIGIEGGAPKFTVNGKPLNNMFGVYVYSTGVDPSSSRFKKEMQAVIDKTAGLGIPVVSFDILWADYDRSTEPPKDAKSAAERFSTDNLDAILDYAAQKGVYVFLQVPVHAHWGLPRWWKEYGDNSTGYQFVDSVSDPSGQYNRQQSPVASFGSPTHRELLRALVRRLVLRYRSHPAVIGWGINPGSTGENGYTPNYLELKFNPALSVNYRLAMADYSPLARRQFIEYLRGRYATIQALNAAWDSGYTRFESVTPPLPKVILPTETLGANGDSRPAMRDWQEFRYAALLDEWRFLAKLVRDLDPGKLVIGKTNWNPLSLDTGSRSMLSTAIGVFSEGLIDADKVDAGITRRDGLPQYVAASSGFTIDYYHLSAFSRASGAARVFCLENWVKTEKDGPSPKAITLERALEVKNLLRQQGAYMWFVVRLESDTHPKPDWSWKEVSRVVENSSANELDGISVKKAPAAFLYSLENSMPNYYSASPDLQYNALSRAVAGALFKGKIDYALLEARQLEKTPPDPVQTKLLILGDQRYVTAKSASALQDYVKRGGSLLMVGANGVFARDGTPNRSALETLADGLASKQKDSIARREIRGENAIPAVLVSRDGVRFGEIPRENPREGYAALRKLVGKLLPLQAEGELNLTAPFGNLDQPRAADSDRPRPDGRHTRAELLRFIADFDRDNTGRIKRDQFPGPQEVFDSFDLNHDGVVTDREATSDP